MDAPILLFAFRRPVHTRRVLASLALNARAKDARLFVFIDGPKRESDPPLIAEVERVAREAPWCGRVEIVRRSENWGVPRSVISTLDEFTDRFGAAVVLEDDVLLSRYFLDFMAAGLERYREEPRVMEITGYRYPVTGVGATSGFTASSVGWGWATWKRAWTAFEPDGRKLLAAIEGDAGLARRFDFEGGYPYLDMLRAQVAGKIGGWDVRWYATMLLRGGLTLYPATALSQNIGLDGSGTNCVATGVYATTLAEHPINDLPDRVEEDPDFRRALRRFFLKTQGPPPMRLLRRLKRALPPPLASALDRLRAG